MKMIRFETPEYLVRLMEKGNAAELREVQRLRYRYLLAEFDPAKNDPHGLDDDGFDAFSDSVLVIEKKTGRIAGTYRLATDETLKGRQFKSEEEFDISALRAAPGGIAEAGRAVVHGDCRNGAVISLLWKGLISYAAERGLRYVIGTCSMHGTDPAPYEDCTSLLRARYMSEDFDVRARHDAFEYGRKTGLSEEDVQIPSLLGAYLRFGARVSRDGFIDYDFNCCDVMIILDLRSADERLMRFIMR